jgi:hypothetical protein
VLAVFIADALYARARIRLRTRAAQATRRSSHYLTDATGSGGWRNLSDEAGERAEPEADTPFGKIDQILDSNARRGPDR